jgi:hypothetical protein
MKLTTLRRALIEGEESGPASYSLQGIIDDLEQEGRNVQSSCSLTKVASIGAAIEIKNTELPQIKNGIAAPRKPHGSQ